jgi:hypothetical protein
MEWRSRILMERPLPLPELCRGGGKRKRKFGHTQPGQALRRTQRPSRSSARRACGGTGWLMYSNRNQLGTYSIWQRRIGRDVLNTRTPPGVTLEAVIREVPGLSLALAYMPVPGVKQMESAAQKQVSKLPAGDPEGQIRTPVGRRTRSEGTSSHSSGPSSQPEPSFVS